MGNYKQVWMLQKEDIVFAKDAEAIGIDFVSGGDGGYGIVDTDISVVIGTDQTNDLIEGLKAWNNDLVLPDDYKGEQQGYLTPDQLETLVDDLQNLNPNIKELENLEVYAYTILGYRTLIDEGAFNSKEDAQKHREAIAKENMADTTYRNIFIQHVDLPKTKQYILTNLSWYEGHELDVSVFYNLEDAKVALENAANTVLNDISNIDDYEVEWNEDKTSFDLYLSGRSMEDGVSINIHEKEVA